MNKIKSLQKIHLVSWGAKSQIGTNFEIFVSNSTNFESSHKFMYRKIGINNYIDMTKFENDADIRYLLTRYISVILLTIRYQIFNFMYNSKFLPRKQISDIDSMRCLALVSMKLYGISETK